MRLKLEISSKEVIVLKKGFIKQLQALIYNLLERSSAKWLHDNGFEYEKRRFKLFTFSSILEKGRYHKLREEFVFSKRISFLLSSPVDWILEQVAENFVMLDECRLGENLLSISSISVLKRPAILEETIKVKALTPITIRSTDKNTKKHKTHSPLSDSFSHLINENLKKKWESYYKKECKYNLKILPLFDDEKKYKRVVTYGVSHDPKRAGIEGWVGTYLLKGEIDLLNFAYDAGLGERNSLGFGMIEVVR